MRSKHTNPNHPGYFVQMVKDSYHAHTKSRLSTIHIRIPWYITPELLRHRALSFSSRSTRAVPISVLLDQVKDPVIPPHFGKNRRGMQAGEELLPVTVECLKTIIQSMGELTASRVGEMSKLGLHKQVCNKYLIPYLWCDLLISSTTWANLCALRIHPDAAPEMQISTELIADCLVESEPEKVCLDQWHLPYITQEDVDAYDHLSPMGKYKNLGMISAARCARISYTPFMGDKVDRERDLALAGELRDSKPCHASPFEHVAQASYAGSGNFGMASGWEQLRKHLDGNVTRSFEWKGKIIL